MKGIDLALDKLQDDFTQIKERISEIRKQGINTDFAFLKTMNIASKIQYAKSTKLYQDIHAVRILLEDIRGELEEAQQHHTIHSLDEYREKANAMMDVARIFAKKKDRKALSDYYHKMKEFYTHIPPQLKKETYKKCVELYQMIQSLS